MIYGRFKSTRHLLNKAVKTWSTGTLNLSCRKSWLVNISLWYGTWMCVLWCHILEKLDHIWGDKSLKGLLKTLKLMVSQSIWGKKESVMTPEEVLYIALMATQNGRATSTSEMSIAVASIRQYTPLLWISRYGRVHMNRLYAWVPRVCVLVGVLDTSSPD